MRYMLLIYSTESADAASAPTEDERQAEFKRWVDYTNEMRDAGVFEAGEPLHPTATATTVRVRDGETLTTDGPFAETKEVLGGFYILNVDDLDQAIEWGRRCPAAEYGSVELRPIADMSAEG